jgi:hypothetical protein
VTIHPAGFRIARSFGFLHAMQRSGRFSQLDLSEVGKTAGAPTDFKSDGFTAL